MMQLHSKASGIRKSHDTSESIDKEIISINSKTVRLISEKTVQEFLKYTNIRRRSKRDKDANKEQQYSVCIITLIQNKY